MIVKLTILGQPCSKANSRQIVVIGGRPKVIKSEVALAYERDAIVQIPPRCRVRLTGPVRATLRLFYTSELSDLDESIVLDVLQDRWSKAKKDQVSGKVHKPRELVQKGVYLNDRQVREKHVYHGIDTENPRAEIEIEALTPQQVGLPQELFDEAEIPF